MEEERLQMMEPQQLTCTPHDLAIIFRFRLHTTSSPFISKL
jgi:hypothetical protein